MRQREVHHASRWRSYASRLFRNGSFYRQLNSTNSAIRCVAEEGAASNFRRGRVPEIDGLRAPPRPSAYSRRQGDHGADRLQRISARNPAAAAFARRARLHRHSPLELHAARRPFCRNGAARAFGARVARVLPAAARVRWLELARGRWCDRKAAHIVACDQIGDQPG